MSYTHLLERVDVFDELSHERLERISNICVEHRYNQGDLIFQENTRSDGLYVILNGEVEIQVDPHTTDGDQQAPGGPLTLAKLRRGQSFGEVALVDEGMRSASARCATSDTRLLQIRRVDLLEICHEDFELGFILMRNLAADLALKMRQTDLMMRQRLMWGPRE
jgi:CRP/FNR family transcriptional regulator, cyclic AMP receptor protein